LRFIDQSRPLADEPLTYPVQRLDILLVDVLDGNKAHGRPCHRFSNGLGIAHVVFVRLHVGLNKLGRHEFDLVALVAQLACPVMGSATGLHADGHRGQLRHKGYQSMARQPLAPHNLSPGVSPHEVKDFFGQIDADGTHVLFHWTRLLAVI